MKKAFILFSLYLLTCHLVAQTAEEVLLKTQNTYRSLENYVDEGYLLSVHFNPDGSALPRLDSSSYFLALDRNKNIQFLQKKNTGINKEGTSYIKSENDSLGLFTRIGTDDPSFPEIPEFAAARSSGRGAPEFSYIGSMFYEDFHSNSDTSFLLRYDWANRLTDTIIDGMSCFVVKTGITIYMSKERADQQNFRRDSIQGLLELPAEQRGGPRAVAGPKYSEQKYYIRKNDLLLLRQVNFRFYENSGAVRFKSILTLNPKTNVKDFKAYLATKDL